jgi:hypothetical protein
MHSNVHSTASPDRLAALAAAVDGLAAQDLAGLPDAARAERVLVLRRLLDRLEGQWLGEVVAVDAWGAAGAETGTPDAAASRAERRHQQRWLWLAPTLEGMVAVGGLLEPEAGQILLSALEPLARPGGAEDARSAGQRRADALTELARRSLEGGRLPQTGGVRPQLIVTVDLDRLLGRHGSLGGEAGLAGPLDPEACRRLACDGALTRVLVSRRLATDRDGNQGPTGNQRSAPPDPAGDGRWAPRLRLAMALLPPVLGGAPTQPLEVGRTSRVVLAAQRNALTVRDGGCVFPGCQRPPAWCEAHHLRHWLHGGPTDLANLALLCRAHHRAVHEGGWRLARGPDGQITAAPPHRRHPAAA